MDKSALKVHMDSIKGEGGKYRCDLCDFKACKHNGLSQHTKREHPNRKNSNDKTSKNCIRRSKRTNEKRFSHSETVLPLPNTQNTKIEVDRQQTGSNMETNVWKHPDEEKSMKCVKIRLDFLPFSKKQKSQNSETEVPELEPDMDDKNPSHSNPTIQMENMLKNQDPLHTSRT